MNQLFKFFHGLTKKSRVNTIITNNRLTRTPIRQILVRQGYNTPEFSGIFLQGWRSCERGEEVYNNPYGNVENLIYSQHSAWEMGYLDCFNTRRTTNPYVEQTREYITDMFRDAQTHGFCAGVNRTQLILHYEGDMDELSVRSILLDLTYRYRTCVSFSDFTLNNMEDFLNEHLSGTSTIRLA
jgi:hypothetical protein